MLKIHQDKGILKYTTWPRENAEKDILVGYLAPSVSGHTPKRK